ncbi:MAG: FAD-dependent oxidoreductase [Pseudonocardia sp.]|nr:FAD-dependent oxidoreductase [Pseudonocardia sp.]
MIAREHTEVLVVGGGIVGLTAALTLAHRGVRVVLAESHPGTSVHPRARGVNGRAMEVYRALGVEDAFRAAGAPLAASHGIHVGHDVVGLIGALPRRAAPEPAPLLGPHADTPWSPTTGSRGTLDVVEPLIADAARRAGARLRFGTRVTRVCPDEGGIHAELGSDTGSTALHARFAVLADGASGGLRERLGVRSRRGSGHGHQINILFEADLSELVRGREFSICMIEQPGLGGMFTALDNRVRWAFHVRYDPASESVADYPPERCADLVARAIGPGAPPVRVLGAQPWEAAERTVDRMRTGPVFLAGDTAHQMPPAGGRGASTGVTDVYELAWKLDAVLRGEAGEQLLETYHDERHPAGVRAVRRSGEAAAWMSAPGRAPAPTGAGSTDAGSTDGIAALTTSLDVHGAGDRYTSAAVLRGPGDPTAPCLDALDGSPGSRIPHVPLDDGRSTVDLARGGWSVVGPPVWIAPARERGLVVHAVGAEPAARLGIDGGRALLVRPDGIVAWRAARGTVDPGGALDAARAALPCRIGTASSGAGQVR